jgi:hypothetical protein
MDVILDLEGIGGPGRDRTDDLFHAMEARSQLRHRPTGGQLSYCPSLDLVRQTPCRWLCVASGFERWHILVLVHKEELAMPEALRLAGLSFGHVGDQIHQFFGGFIQRDLAR